MEVRITLRALQNFFDFIFKSIILSKFSIKGTPPKTGILVTSNNSLILLIFSKYNF